MRIAFYVPSWPAGAVANGIVTYAAQMIPALRKLGHEVFVVTYHRSNNDPDPYTIELRKYVMPRSVWQRALFRISPENAAYYETTKSLVVAIRDLISKQKIDVLEMEESFGWSRMISRRCLLPVVVRLHGPWFINRRFNPKVIYSASDRRREKREQEGIKAADYVTAPSLDVLRSVKFHYGLELDRSMVFPNPIDAVPEADRWKLETCDLDSLLYVGRFDELKGGDLVVRAFGKLAMIYPRLKLTFVGPDNGVVGPDGKPIFFDAYCRNVLSEDARLRLTFKGKLLPSEIAQLRAKNFVTLCASQIESLSYAVLEAMSFGCPIVATAVGGIPELIQSERNGLLCRSQDLEGMVSACCKILNDRSLAASLGKQAWQDCGDYYGSENLAKKSVLVYQAAIDAFKIRCRV